MLVLVGDIGGTMTRMQLTDFGEEGEASIIRNARYKSSDYSSLMDIIDVFFKDTDLISKVKSVCFGVAGPIFDDTVRFTNLPWIINTSNLKDKFSLDKVILLNDFVTIGYGFETLKHEDVITLQAGRPVTGALKAYLGAGTGLGVGFVSYELGSPKVYSTEGGHVDFAPTDDEQIELLKFLRKKHHRVSFERVLSRDGLVNIYHFVQANRSKKGEENPKLSSLVDDYKQIDVAAIIAEHVSEYGDPLARRTLDIFTHIYGSAAGNLALTTLPYGGIYVVGGMIPSLLPLMKTNIFLQAFSDKGRMSDLIKEIPLHIILNTDVGLQGAALYARHLFLK